MRRSNILFGILFLLALSAGLPLVSASGCGTTPSSISSLISSCIPVNIVNTNGATTASGLQVLFSNTPVNVLVGNVVVYNGISGAVVPAWAETYNSLWVNLGANVIAGSTGANGIYYLGIASSGVNFFPGGANGIGESPTQSPFYAEYDTGNIVFPILYQNFLGTSTPSGWATAGTVTINNGITVGTGSSGYMDTIGTFGDNSAEILDFYGSTPTQTGPSAMNIGFNDQGEAGAVIAGLCMMGAGGCNGGANYLGFGNSDSVPGTYTPTGFTTTSPEIYSLHWSSSAGFTAQQNYGTPVVSGGSTTSTGTYVGVVQSAGGANGAPGTILQWFRIRLNPPGGVMPTVTYGSAPTASSISISPNPAVYDQPVTITATCQTGDTCLVTTLSNVVLASGTTSATYTYCSGQNAETCNAPSALTFNGVDSTLGTNALATLTINKGPTILSESNCGNEIWLGVLGYQCSTTASFVTQNSVDAAQQIVLNQFLNNLDVGSTTTSTNSVTNTISNTILCANYVANVLGTGNFVGNSITQTWCGYTPLYIENWSTTYSSAAPGTPNVIDTWHYPIKLYTQSPSNNIIFNLNRSINSGSWNTVMGHVLNISYVPPNSDATGNYVYEANEVQPGNPLSTVVVLNQTLDPVNMLVLNHAAPAFNLTNENIQYFPVALWLSNTVWYSPPIRWLIDGSTNTTPSNIIVTKGSNILSLPLNLQGVYGFTSVNLTNSIGGNILGLSANALSLQNFEEVARNTSANGIYTREILNISSYNQRNLISLVANTTTFQTALFNNYVISNSTSFNWNAFKIYIPESTFQNPNYTFSTLTLGTSAPSHVLEVNNYCSSTISNSQFRSLYVYPVDNANGTYVVFNIYSGFNSNPVNQFIQVLKGINNLTATSVQQFRITQVPFQLPLIQGGDYAFRVLNGSNCNIIYATNFSIWTSPITLQLPNNLNVPHFKLGSPTATCTMAFNSILNTSVINCAASDPTNLVERWNVSVTNYTNIENIYPINAVNLTGSGITYTYYPLSAKSEYKTKVCAIEPSNSTPVTCFTFILNNIFTAGYNTAINGFLALLFYIVGAVAGIKGSEGLGSNQHELSNTCFIEVLMTFFLWGTGLTSFLGTAVNAAIAIFLLIVGIVRFRNESIGGGQIMAG